MFTVSKKRGVIEDNFTALLIRFNSITRSKTTLPNSKHDYDKE